MRRARHPEVCIAALGLGALMLGCGASTGHRQRDSQGELSTGVELDEGAPGATTPATSATSGPGQTEAESPRSIFLSILRTQVSAAAADAGRAARSDAEFGARLAITLQVDADGGAFGEITRRSSEARLSAGRLHIGSLTALEARDPAEPRHHAVSFLIDHDEPAVLKVADEAKHAFGARPRPAELESFVYGYIDDKRSSSFETASRIAQTRSGDCKAHAVLLAALLRHFDYRAHVVLGIALVAVPQTIVAAGHAWVEYHDGRRWKALDAALYRPPETQNRSARSIDGDEELPLLHRAHLPMQLLDEGPSFGGALLQGQGLFQVRAVEIDARVAD